MNKDSYNKIALQWTNERHQYSFVSKLVIEFANKIKPDGAILDIGCGSGIPNAAYLSERGFKVTGIDASEKMIGIAKQQNIRNAHFEVCDMFEYKPANTFDGILAWDSFFHMPYAKQHTIYEIASHWLNTGGWFLFSHGGVDSEFIGEEMYGEKFYYSSLSTNTIKQLLTDFKIEFVKEDYSERDMDKGLVVLCQKK